LVILAFRLNMKECISPAGFFQYPLWAPRVKDPGQIFAFIGSYQISDTKETGVFFIFPLWKKPVCRYNQMHGN